MRNVVAFFESPLLMGMSQEAKFTPFLLSLVGDVLNAKTSGLDITAREYSNLISPSWRFHTLTSVPLDITKETWEGIIWETWEWVLPSDFPQDIYMVNFIAPFQNGVMVTLTVQ